MSRRHPHVRISAHVKHAPPFTRDMFDRGRWRFDRVPDPAACDCGHDYREHQHVGCAGRDECWPVDGSDCSCERFVPMV